ncbi:hypothetical protein ACJX0J_006362, partial [Zea mays]
MKEHATIATNHKINNAHHVWPCPRTHNSDPKATSIFLEYHWHRTISPNLNVRTQYVEAQGGPPRVVLTYHKGTSHTTSLSLVGILDDTDYRDLVIVIFTRKILFLI